MRKLLPLLCAGLMFLLAFVQTITVSGVVRDENGKPIPFAVIRVKGEKNTVQSDANGTFSIQVTNEKAVLEVSAIGYKTFEMRVKGKTAVTVVMKRAVHAMEEVVVTGINVDQSVLSGSAPHVNTRGVARGQVLGYTGNGFYEQFNTEDYDRITETGFHRSSDEPLSTFSIDVDAASYSNVRRFLNSGQLPPKDAVRIEEMINYFHYDYPQPKNETPFSINTELTDCPWNKEHRIVMIGMQGLKVPVENLPASNLTFLIDVSGSMMSENKLPLVKTSLKLLVDQLREEDRISIVVYAGAAGLVLEPTTGDKKIKIREAIDQLQAGGSTAGGEGIKLAYKTARANFRKGGNNRVILCTDGDFNVGASSDGELERLIENERESGVFLTVLGYGMGNYKDNKMQKLANKGNGNHAYIDGVAEAKKVLVNEFGGTLFTIAKDVKLQVEFNPATVAGYRLIGYENRMLKKEDFNDDRKDAGELGSGHTVTALYEVIPGGVNSEFLKNVDELKYQVKPKKNSNGTDLLTVKFRYKKPDDTTSRLIDHVVKNNAVSFETASANLRFAAAVAQFGMLLRDSEFKGTTSYSSLLKAAKAAQGKDVEGYRAEFFTLVRKAYKFSRKQQIDDEEDLAATE